MPWLCWGLKGKYRNTPLALSTLKGNDAGVVAQMARICSESDFTVLLADIHLNVRGTCEPEDDYIDPYDFEGLDRSGEDDDYHSITEVEEEEWTLSKVNSLDGKEVTGQVSVSRQQLSQEKWFEGERGEEVAWQPGEEVEHHYEGVVSARLQV